MDFPAKTSAVLHLEPNPIFKASHRKFFDLSVLKISPVISTKSCSATDIELLFVGLLFVLSTDIPLFDGNLF